MKTIKEFVNENFNNDEHQQAISNILIKINDIIEKRGFDSLIIYPNGKIVSTDFDSKISNLVVKDKNDNQIKVIIEVAASSEVEKNVCKVRFIQLSLSSADQIIDAFVYDYQDNKWYNGKGDETSWSNHFRIDLAK